MKRHNSRIISVMTVFNLDMNKEFKFDEQAKLNIDLDHLQEKVEEVKNLILDDEFQIEIDDDYINAIVNSVCDNYEEIIKLISTSLVNWTIDRLSYVDRAIIICATTEMIKRLAPKEVIINEYLDITKEYSMIVDEKQVKFNNRVLDNISGKIYE